MAERKKKIKLIKDSEKLCKSKNFEVKNNYDLTVDMIQKLEQVLTDYPKRLYACSNELGFAERAIILRTEKENLVFFNPAIQHAGVPIFNREYDIHNTKDEYIITRYTDVVLDYQTCLGEVKTVKLNEGGSVVVCQAMDLLNGITAKDYGLPILEGFDDLPEDGKKEILSDYMENIKKKYKELDIELENDENETIRRQWKDAKYLKGLSDGTIETMEQPLSNRKKKKLKKLAKQAKSYFNRMKFWRTAIDDKSKDDKSK